MHAGSVATVPVNWTTRYLGLFIFRRRHNRAINQNENLHHRSQDNVNAQSLTSAIFTESSIVQRINTRRRRLASVSRCGSVRWGMNHVARVQAQHYSMRLSNDEPWTTVLHPGGACMVVQLQIRFSDFPESSEREGEGSGVTSGKWTAKFSKVWWSAPQAAWHSCIYVKLKQAIRELVCSAECWF